MEELQEMCRVCMAEAEDLLDIYDEEKTHVDDRLADALKKTAEAEPTLPELMKECSSLAVESDDPFPKKVCDPCLRKLRNAVYFHRRYIRSMDYIGRVKSEKIDQAVVNDLELEEWDLKVVKSENEEEDDEDEENEEDKENDEEDEDEEDEEDEDEYEENEDEEEDEDEDENGMDDFSDDGDDEYMPKAKKQKDAKPAVNSREPPKTSRTNTRPKRNVKY